MFLPENENRIKSLKSQESLLLRQKTKLSDHNMVLMSTWESGNGIRSASVWNNGLLITISNTLHNTSNVFLCQKQFGKEFRSLENNFIIWIAKMPQSTGLKQEGKSKWPVQKYSPCWWTIDTVLITDLMWPLSFCNWMEWPTKSHESPCQCCGVLLVCVSE